MFHRICWDKAEFMGVLMGIEMIFRTNSRGHGV